MAKYIEMESDTMLTFEAFCGSKEGVSDSTERPETTDSGTEDKHD